MNTKHTIELNQDEYNALIACVEYLLENEQGHYGESLDSEGDTNPNHIYYKAQALSHIKYAK